MKYGLLSYTTDNIGDEIQSIAARQFLPRVDEHLRRDYLNQVTSDEKIKLILNGWFSHHPENWPPSPTIDPLFISFHISKEAEDEFTSPESVEYLSQHEPIGCRDYPTRDLLRQHDVEAYFSGCLTLTLNNQYSNRNSGEIYLVDIDESVVNNIPQKILENSEHLTHNYSARSPEGISSSPLETTQNRVKQLIGRRLDNSAKNTLKRFGIGGLPHKKQNQMKFQQAQEYLNKYAQAQLVITRRLHVTLPCIAFGTPVILVHENPDDPRFNGLKQYINIYSIEEFNKISASEILSIDTNPGDISDIIDELEKRVEQFLSDSIQHSE